MEGRIRRIVRQRASHFVLGEEGKVGSRSAFAAATAISVTSLSTALLLGAPQKALAAIVFCGYNGGVPVFCNSGLPGQGGIYCCGAAGGGAFCSKDYIPGQGCWWIPGG